MLQGQTARTAATSAEAISYHGTKDSLKAGGRLLLDGRGNCKSLVEEPGKTGTGKFTTQTSRSRFDQSGKHPAASRGDEPERLFSMFYFSSDQVDSKA